MLFVYKKNYFLWNICVKYFGVVIIFKNYVCIKMIFIIEKIFFIFVIMIFISKYVIKRIFICF